MKQLDPKAVWLFFISFVLRAFIPIIFLSIYGAVILGEFSFGFLNWLWIIVPAFLVLCFVWAKLTYYFYRYELTDVGFLNWLWIIVPAFLVLCFVWAKLTYYFYRYELTDVGFRKELGVIYKKYVTIPYDRIQNVDIYRGILARLLGLSDLNIQTAGMSATINRYGVSGGGAEGRLPALSREVAEQLRDELIQRARQAKNQGL